MKKSSIICSLIAAALLMTAAIPAHADYYTVAEYRTRCRNEGENMAKGLGIGAIAGCGIGLLFGGKGKDCARGAVAGAVTGGLIGLAASCKDEVRYMTYWDNNLDTCDVSSEYNDWGGNVSARVTYMGYDHRGYMCKEFESYNNGRYHRTVSCKEGRHWRHGYNRTVIVREYSSYSGSRTTVIREESRRPRRQHSYTYEESYDYNNGYSSYEYSYGPAW